MFLSLACLTAAQTFDLIDAFSCFVAQGDILLHTAYCNHGLSTEECLHSLFSPFWSGNNNNNYSTISKKGI